MSRLGLGKRRGIASNAISLESQVDSYLALPVHLLRALSCTGRYVEVCHALSIIDTLSGTPASMANLVQVSHGSVASSSNLSPM